MTSIPFVWCMRKELKYNLNFNLKHNSIVCGDCEEWLQFIPDNEVDLIYIDPPFFSKKDHGMIWGNGYEERAFKDRWKGGIENYIEWMEPKIKIAKKKLKDTGVIALHCDKHASHRLRCLLVNIFGEKNFVNEIIWYYSKWTNSPNIFQQNHDNIYIYKKDKPYIFNRQYQDARDVRSWKLNTIAEGNKRINQIIIYDKPATEKAFKEGKIKFKKEDLRVIYREKNKVAMDDVWDLGVLSSNSPERIGYKTQKPERLVKRFIECFSNEKSLVLDFFGGGGTTAKVCADLNRRFITGDVSPVAVRVTADRLLSEGYNDYDIKVTADRLLAYRNKGYEVKFLPSTKEEFLKLNDKSIFGTEGSHWFSKMICEFKGWKSNPKKSNDGGIDGWANDGKVAIQIKNHKNKIRRQEIQSFFGAVSGKYEEGIFVAWGFSTEAEEYRAEKDGVIKFEKIENIIGSTLLGEDTRLLSKGEREKHQKLFYGVHKEKNGKVKYKGVSKKIKKSPFHKQEEYKKSASAVEIQKEQEKSKRKRKTMDDSRKKIGTSVNNAKTSISGRKKSLL